MTNDTTKLAPLTEWAISAAMLETQADAVRAHFYGADDTTPAHDCIRMIQPEDCDLWEDHEQARARDFREWLASDRRFCVATAELCDALYFYASNGADDAECIASARLDTAERSYLLAGINAQKEWLAFLNSSRISVNDYYEKHCQPIRDALDFADRQNGTSARALPADFYTDEGIGEDCRDLIDECVELAEKFGDEIWIKSPLYDALYSQMLTWYYS